MNANALTRHYDRISPEERFRLILAAGARGDEAEQDRLCQTAPRLTLSYSEHAPWAHAFDQLATLVFVELLEEVARHHDAFERWSDAVEADRAECDEEANDEDEETNGDDEMPDPASVAEVQGEPKPPQWERMLQLYYAQGFVLRAKVAGWNLFCERLTLPPFVLWNRLPGFDRLERAIELVEGNRYGPPPAFEPEGMVRWLNGIRRESDREATLGSLLSPERFADDLDCGFRQVVAWRSG
jgi:hypothetical protein